MSQGRIAMIVPSLRGGGLEQVVRDLVLRLRDRGFAPGVFGITGLGVHAATLAEAGIPLYDCQEHGFRIRGVPRVLLRHLRSFKPDLIHGHSGTWLASVVAKRLGGGTPLVFTDHGRYPPEPRFRALIERWCARHTDRTVVVSDTLGRYLRHYLGLVDAPQVIPNGIDLAKFQQHNALRRRQLREEWGIARTDLVGIAVGRLVEVKNHLGMVRALSQVEPVGGRGVSLAFLGSGPLEPSIRAEAARRGLENRVIFLGFRSDVAECLHAADFWLSASTTEGLPLSLLEAMAAGLPIIAPAVGGIPETLGEPPAGLLVPPQDDSGLAEAISAVATDPGSRARLGRSAAERAQGYSLDEMTARYVRTYHELLDGRMAA